MDCRPILPKSTTGGHRLRYTILPTWKKCAPSLLFLELNLPIKQASSIEEHQSG